MVKDRPEPERIEIELTSNAPSPVDSEPPDAAASGSTDVEAVHAAGSDQRRLYATATIVGVVALLLGWLIGRGTSGDEVATTSATTPETTEAVAVTVLPGETLPAVSTTQPRRTTTTTTTAPPTVEEIQLDPRLAGVELTLVGSQRSTHGLELVELDLSQSTLNRRSMGRINEAQSLIVGDDWIVVLSMNGSSTLVRDGEPAGRVELGDPWGLLWQEGTDLFWRPPNEIDYPSDPWVYLEVDLTGEPTGRTLEVPSGTGAQQTDPGGGLIVEASGKSYSISESGASQIGIGQMLGVSTNTAVTRDCDEQLRCGLFVTDRLTGTVSEVDVEMTPAELTSIQRLWSWSGSRIESISPDGSMCVVVLLGERAPQMAVIDLESGDVVQLGPMDWPSPVVWSPDSRFAFFLDGGGAFGGPGPGHLSAYDRETDDVVPVIDQVMWEALGARPAGAGATDGP